jgi:DNA polymerase
MDEFEATLSETIEKLRNFQAMGIEYISVAPPAPAKQGAAFLKLNEVVAACTKCARHEGREKAALGMGSEKARVVFVSSVASTELTGGFSKEEKELLSNIIRAMGLSMDEVYLTSLVRCAGGEAPGSEEVEGCLPFLKDEVDIINPEVIVAMGELAAASLAVSDVGFANIRGIMRSFDDVPLMVTHHPSALLKDASLKRAAWEDMKKVMALL